MGANSSQLEEYVKRIHDLESSIEKLKSNVESVTIKLNDTNDEVQRIKKNLRITNQQGSDNSYNSGTTNESMSFSLDVSKMHNQSDLFHVMQPSMPSHDMMSFKTPEAAPIGNGAPSPSKTEITIEAMGTPNHPDTPDPYGNMKVDETPPSSIEGSSLNAFDSGSGTDALCTDESGSSGEKPYKRLKVTHTKASIEEEVPSQL